MSEIIDYPFKQSALQNAAADMNLPRLTPSNVDALDCKKRFQTLYVEKRWPARDVQPQLRFGNALHDVLKNVYDPRLTRTSLAGQCEERRHGDGVEAYGDKPDLRHIDALSSVAFRAYRFPDEKTRQTEQERCKTMVRNYVSNDEEDGVTTLGVEVQGAFPVYHQGRALFMLTAKLDRVLIRDSEPTTLYVRDYKTLAPGAQARVDMFKSFLNLWISKLLYPGFQRYVLEYDFISEDGGGLHREIVDSSEMKGLYALVMQKVARVLLSDEHPPEKCEGCVFCPLRETCLATAASPPGIPLPMASVGGR